MIDNAGAINMAEFCFDEASEGPESLFREPSVTPDKFLTSAMTIESGSSIHISSCFAFGTESLQFGEDFVVYI